MEKLMRNTFIIAIAGLTFGAVSGASAVTCERACLLDLATQFNADMLVNLSRSARIVSEMRMFPAARGR